MGHIANAVHWHLSHSSIGQSATPQIVFSDLYRVQNNKESYISLTSDQIHEIECFLNADGLLQKPEPISIPPPDDESRPSVQLLSNSSPTQHNSTSQNQPTESEAESPVVDAESKASRIYESVVQSRLSMSENEALPATQNNLLTQISSQNERRENNQISATQNQQAENFKLCSQQAPDTPLCNARQQNSELDVGLTTSNAQQPQATNILLSYQFKTCELTRPETPYEHILGDLAVWCGVEEQDFSGDFKNQEFIDVVSLLDWWDAGTDELSAFAEHEIQMYLYHCQHCADLHGGMTSPWIAPMLYLITQQILAQDPILYLLNSYHLWSRRNAAFLIGQECSELANCYYHEC
ncbi:predicted protein [Uncinocarpus reesii 1704]|uniref:Uncharacterized protein n=1 Tax=Uncinocarpus reesii (strain UAMH 1704) TaxID=336963 RepID=C4JXW5_UNCRE|nr:uncharacterized protein UREG_07016 [Uncinocarpus reesii 1704]EEP82151.1 predicted protein [Uncinocarpus reesii 1704]